DHLSDVIYTYFDEYKQQGIAEGINPSSIVVVQNLIVDVLDAYYFARKSTYDALASPSFFDARRLVPGEYYLMTCHRRENVQIRSSLEAILRLIAATDRTVYFPASYRTQRMLREFGLVPPRNVVVVDPIGYQEMLALLVNARAVITDSGTVVEETCVLQVPSLQLRKATERPQVYDASSRVKFDPAEPHRYPHQTVFRKLESLRGRRWEHSLGDGKASERIVRDLVDRVRHDGFRLHRPEAYHLDIRRSYREDGLPT